MSNLFIPKTIRVGFQERKDTYTGRLAYVIYYDAKGTLRKEKSWQTWRNDKIKPEEFDNTPQDGFVLNKDIQRYNWSHFGSNRSYIRIYDSRGIEFEITPENLIGILTETNCSKRGLEGKFVYAWCGPELVILPCCSEAYTQATENTERQGKKISARNLKPGCSYTTKKGEEVIYIGRFMWFTWERYSDKGRISQKKHVFAYPEKKYRGYRKPEQFFPKNDATFLAELNNADPVSNYADLVDAFNANVHSSTIDEWTTKPLKPKSESVFRMQKKHHYQELNRTAYTSMKDGVVSFWILHFETGGYANPEITGYRLELSGTLDTKALKYTRNANYDSYGYRRNKRFELSKQQVLDKLVVGFVEVSMVLSSGKTVHLKEFDSIAVD